MKFWYAVQNDYDDDLGTGSFDFDEAVKIAKRDGGFIVKVDANYDDDGNPTSDWLVTDEYRPGIDF